MGTERITVRLSDDHLDALDEIAEQNGGGSRSQAIRRLIDRGQPGISAQAKRLDEDDLVALLEERAKAGSTAAASKLLAIHEQRRSRAELDRLNTISTGRDTA